jgi:mRNA interferase MazF
MIQEGQIVLFTFPQTNQAEGKMRPALVVRSLPGPHDDWLVCMISSQLRHEVPQVDEVIRETDSDFHQTGLKETSLIRVTRIAVISEDILHGTIGYLSKHRLDLIRSRLSDWVGGTSAPLETDKTEIAEEGTAPKKE